MEKMTIKDYFMEVRAIVEKEGRNDLVEFIDGRIAQVKAKNARKSNKPSKSAIETADLAERVLSLMETGTRYTASEMVKAVGEVGVSNQRMTAALNVLVNSGFVVNEREKGKSYFIKA